MEKLFEVCNDQAWPTVANIMAEWLCGFNQVSLLTESYEKTMRHCCPQMALPWEAGARQAVLINITICVFVLKKKKSRRLLGYIPGRTELSLEMDGICVTQICGFHRFLQLFPPLSSSVLQRAPTPHPGPVVSRLHVETTLNRKEPGYRPINQ